MNYSRTYGGVIWTNHAIERLQGRKMSQELAWKAFRFPDATTHGKREGSMEFTKQIDKYSVTVIAKKSERNEWLILSCWIDPPLAGSVDLTKTKTRSPSALQWIWSALRKILFP